MSKAISKKRDFTKIQVNGKPLEVLQVLGIEVPIWRDSEGSEVWIFLRPVVEQLGLSWPRQNRKIQEDSPVFEDTVALKATVSPHQNSPEESITREALFIKRKGFLFWLARLSSSRVKPEKRALIERFHMEVADALERYFTQGVAVNPTAVASAPEQVTRNFVSQAVKALPQEKLAMAKEALAVLDRLAELTGQKPDAHTSLLIRETVADALLELRGGVSREHSASLDLWTVEDLREHLGVPEGVWIRYRSVLGRKLKTLNLPSAGVAHKLINGSLRKVRVYHRQDLPKAVELARSYLHQKGVL